MKLKMLKPPNISTTKNNRNGATPFTPMTCSVCGEKTLP